MTPEMLRVGDRVILNEAEARRARLQLASIKRRTGIVKSIRYPYIRVLRDGSKQAETWHFDFWSKDEGGW